MAQVLQGGEVRVQLRQTHSPNLSVSASVPLSITVENLVDLVSAWNAMVFVADCWPVERLDVHAQESAVNDPPDSGSQ